MFTNFNRLGILAALAATTALGSTAMGQTYRGGINTRTIMPQPQFVAPQLQTFSTRSQLMTPNMQLMPTRTQLMTPNLQIMTPSLQVYQPTIQVYTPAYVSPLVVRQQTYTPNSMNYYLPAQYYSSYQPQYYTESTSYYFGSAPSTVVYQITQPALNSYYYETINSRPALRLSIGMLGRW